MSVPTYTTTGEGIVFSHDAFIRDYTIQFVATWTAQRFEDYCASDRHDQLGKPPFEDALFCAEEAWKHLTETIKP